MDEDYGFKDFFAPDELIRRCIGCGKEYRPVRHNQTYCSAECRKANSKTPPNKEYDTRSADFVDEPSCMEKIVEINKLAREQHKSYGEYIATTGLLVEATKIRFPKWVRKQENGVFVD